MMQAALPTSPELQAIKNLKQIAREEYIAPGTSVCGGCGGLEALRLAAKVLGPKTVFVNAAGCFTLLAVFPYTPCKGSWLYTTMASAAAGAQGVRDALDVLMARGKMSPDDDVEVVVVAGDGSTYDMALIPHRRRPVEDYLQGQGRYRHLFEPTRNAEAIARIQEQVETYWSEVAQTAGVGQRASRPPRGDRKV